MEKQVCSNYPKLLSKLKADIQTKIKDSKFYAGIYIGKTNDIERRTREHKEKHGYVYVTPIVYGDSLSISKLEEALIGDLKKEGVNILNKSEDSVGNNEANILYICFDSCHPNDELCEWDNFKIGNNYPLYCK